MNPYYSVVIPLYNEAGNIRPLVEKTISVLETRGRPYEVILVNDGSTDGTAAEIAEVSRTWPQCRELALAKNQGQATALLTGLRAARAPLIVTLDGDGQNDPADLPVLMDLVESNTLDLACGWRAHRNDPWIRRVMSRIANTVRSRVLGDRIHDAGCQLRVFRRELVAALFPYELLQSFLPAIAVAAGLRVGERPVRHHARQLGVAKFGFRQLWWRPGVAMWRLRRQLRAKYPR